MCHIFYIYSSVDGHLGYFHILVIVNSAVMNIEVHVSFQIIVLSGICAGVELLDHMATLLLVFNLVYILMSCIFLRNFSISSKISIYWHKVIYNILIFLMSVGFAVIIPL